MESANDNKTEKAFFSSLKTLAKRKRDGSLGEIIDDWRWIFTYTRRHRLAVVFYTVLGILSTTMGLVASVAGKYMIDHHRPPDLQARSDDRGDARQRGGAGARQKICDPL